MDFKVERGRKKRIVGTPLRDEGLDDVQFAHVSEYSRIHAVFHHRQRVAHDQLIGCQSTVALARQGAGNDAAQPAQLPSVRDDLQLRRHPDEILEGEGCALGDAQNPKLETATYCFVTGDLLG